MLVLVYILVALLVTLYFTFKWKNRKFYELMEILGDSGILSLPILGVAHIFAGDGEVIMSGLETLGRHALKRNGITSIWLAHNFFVIIADPVLAEHVSKTCLQKHHIMHKSMQLFLGTSSIIAPVSIWRGHRRVLAPTFCTKNIKQYTNVFAEQSKILVEKIRPLSKSPISILNHYMKYSMESISQSTLGVKLDVQHENKQHPFLAGIEEGASFIAKRFVQPWLLNDFIYKSLPSYKIIRKYNKYYKSFLDQIINSLRESNQVKPLVGNKFKSLMELLVSSSESEQELSDQEIREETLGVTMAATETTALALGYISYLLAEHPDVQEKAFKELTENFEKEETLTSERISCLNYLEAVVKEALRLYPPVPVIARIVEEDCELPSGVVLPAGCGVLLHLSAINRNPEYWGADADQFRPERFLDSSPKHPAQFSTFSFGPRNCIGKAYAMTSLKSMIATVLRNYRFTPASGSGCTTERASKGLRLTYAVAMKDLNNFPVRLHIMRD